ncbi:hypothetical protein KIN20_015922 [Parelaphostrongylus tenuis]|uniref:Uncharacterized protein n=1 Tax=Parelaphostrongylus tenuis TaxID=148309 RepID=A0AAD5MXZ2_PARTN|nr:hypothetical protein KIN20_015922 [Parelaphostrongylus tenuis]
MLAAVDLILQFSLSPFHRVPNCPSAGCFQNDKFNKYMATSNMVMSIVVVVLTIIFLMKLRCAQRKPQLLKDKKWRGNIFRQVNRNCVGILLTSLVTVTLPSVIIGACGNTIASIFGPCYIIGLLCAGLCRSVVPRRSEQGYERFGSQIHHSERKCISHTSLFA